MRHRLSQTKKHQKDKGAILALMLMLVLLISLSSVALIAVARQARIRTVKNVTEVAARFAADAGIERTLYVMNQKLRAGTWTEDDVPTYTAEPLTAANADYTVNYTGSLAGGYQITSVGRSGRAAKTVRVTVELSSPLADDFAVLTNGLLKVKNNSIIGGYNSNDPTETNVPANIGTLSTEDDSIDIGNNTVVNGNIYIGVEGDPDRVIKLAATADVTGETFVMPKEYYLPTITPPDYPASKGSISGKNITLTASDSGKYNSITINNNGKLSIDNDVVLYITGDIQLNNNAAIEIDTAGSLKLYFEGDLKAQNNAGINNLGQIASKSILYGTGQNQTVEINNNNDLYSVIYAPNADMQVFNNINLYGSFIVKSLELKNNAEIYFDKALKETSINDEGIYFTITRWEEL